MGNDEYKQEIIQAFKDAGFKLDTVEIKCESMYRVINQSNVIIGYLIIDSDACSVGSQSYSIPFDDLKKSEDGPKGVQLSKNGQHVASLNL